MIEHQLPSVLIDEADLLKWVGYEKGQRERLRKWLIQNNIPYRPGKDGKLCVVAYDLSLKQTDELVA